MIVVKVKNISRSEEIEVSDRIQNFLNDNGMFPNVVEVVTEEDVVKSGMDDVIRTIVGTAL